MTVDLQNVPKHQGEVTVMDWTKGRLPHYTEGWTVHGLLV